MSSATCSGSPRLKAFGRQTSSACCSDRPSAVRCEGLWPRRYTQGGPSSTASTSGTTSAPPRCASPLSPRQIPLSLPPHHRPNFCTAHLRKGARMAVAQHVHNHGHRIRCANVAVSRWIDVDDLQAQAVVDQRLHRHRPGRRNTPPETWRGRAASLTNTDGPARHGIRDHSPVVTRSWIIDQRPSAIAVTSVLLARFFGIAQPLRSRRSGGR